MEREDDDDSIPATQPVRTLLLDGVVAYVEVRSGHDNRSRGVKTQLKKLGARVVDTLTKDVTHVVFNEGLPSTYKKAKKMKCHLVSVLWIEACKEELAKVCEAGYPPIGQQVYENPQSLKNFKKLKSMQPDFDEEVAIAKTNKVRKIIQRRKPKVVEPTKDDNNSDSEVNISSSETNTNNTGIPTKKPPRTKSTRTSTSLKNSKKALKEITPVIINKSSTCNEPQKKKTTITEEKRSAREENANESLQRAGSSSESVIFCGVVHDVPSISTTRRKKSSEASCNKEISRAEFVEGLSTVVRSLSENNQKWAPSEISPWRRRLYEGNKKVLPPSQVPQKKGLSSTKTSLPRKSQRQLEEQEKLSKKSDPVSASASAARLQKQKMPPPSPLEPFMLLSQEPGDMPSLDELARMKKGAINVGGAPITLSQIVRSYDAVAKKDSSSFTSAAGESKSPSQPEVNFKSSQNSNKGEHVGGQETLIYVEDAECDAEVVEHCGNTCPSDAGSTMSSASTRVLINGMASERSNVSFTNTLPGLEEEEEKVPSVGGLLAPSTLEDRDVETCERKPSPVFVIKKAKFRRPLKKIGTTLKKDVGPSTSSDFQIINDSENNHQHGLGDSKTEDNSNSTSAEANKKKGSINPMDYINKIFLPKFLMASSTPNNIESTTVYVEETPDIVCNMKNEVPSVVIPPTPAVEMECVKNDTIVSPTQSLTGSVISWMKSCKVPLFGKKKCETPSSRQAVLDSVSKSPKKVFNETVDTTQVTSAKAGSVKSVTQHSRKDEVDKDQDPTFQTQSKDSEDSIVPSDTQQPLRMSTRKQQSLSPSKSVRSKITKKLEDSGNNVSNATASNPLPGKKSEESSGIKTRRRVKVKSTLEPNNCGTPTNKPQKSSSVKQSPARVNKNEKQESSSGYDTSNSQVTLLKKSPEKHSDICSSKRKRISEIVSPIQGPAKKRSAVYETSTTSTLDNSQDTDSPPQPSGRKRTNTVPSLHSKRVKLNSSEPSVHSKTTRQSRVDSSLSLLKTRSQSDLSNESSQSSERKSSVVAKKRLAKSLTRSYSSNTPKVIVCTFLTTSEQNGIDVAGEALSRWKLEDKVTSRTTHVINSGPKRTLNMIKGMARGCWLVDQKWMLDSSKAGDWLEEEQYELVKFSPAVRQCRLKRQTMGKEFKHDLFCKVGTIYVSPKTENPPAKEVREILELCGAELISSHKEANIIVGVKMNHKGSYHCVNARWVLDSVTKNKVLSVSEPSFQIE